MWRLKSEINLGRFRGAEPCQPAVRRVMFVPNFFSFLHVGGPSWGARSDHLEDFIIDWVSSPSLQLKGG